MYAKECHIDLEDVQKARSVPLGGKKHILTTFNGPKACMKRTAFIIRKYKNKLREAYKHLCMCADNQVYFEEFKNNGTKNNTPLTR